MSVANKRTILRRIDMEELKPCICGSDDISAYEERYFFFSNHAFIKCNKCGKTIERGTLKQAVKAWNTKRF